MHKAVSEKHPLKPFLPEKACIVMLGSFPPKKERWSMEFFYPNWINDMWRIMGLLFFNDKEHFVAADESGTKQKRFEKERCVDFATKKGIAMYDAASEVIRLKDNASDRFLEIVTPTDIDSLLREIPHCSAIVTTGQKATDIVCGTFGCTQPPVGGYSTLTAGSGKEMRLWRMPSSSRAYPLAIEKKAEYYRRMMLEEGLLKDDQDNDNI